MAKLNPTWCGAAFSLDSLTSLIGLFSVLCLPSVGLLPGEIYDCSYCANVSCASFGRCLTGKSWGQRRLSASFDFGLQFLAQ